MHAIELDRRVGLSGQMPSNALTTIVLITDGRSGKEYNFFFKTFLDLTDVCPLLTKQYIQVGLQIQYMLYNF
jgi:hypothetical protein